MWAKTTSEGHLASSHVTVELYFNEFSSVIIDYVATMYMEKGETVLLLTCL